MSTVETVRGPIDADALGLTLGHEHLRVRDEAVAQNWPGRYDEDAEYAAAVEQVRAAQRHGVKTIVEPTAMFAGRDIPFVKRVSDETGMNFVVCTGIYTYGYLPPYFENRDVDLIAEHFIDDIEIGIQGTEIKAAFMKCSADAAGVTEQIEKVHRACARASLKTGAPIMAHSMPAERTGLRQVEIFLDEGVAPEKIQIAHCGDTADVEYIESLLSQGVYVGLDRYGLDMVQPVDQRNETAAELLRRGHAERLIFSHDYCCSIDWFPPEAFAELLEAIHENWSFTLVFDEVVPRLREQGVMDDAVFETIFIKNSARWLAR
jgi:phosphotriesterase-related protein